MITQELLDWVKQQIDHGIAPEEVRKTLLASGWQEVDVTYAFSHITAPTAVGLSLADQENEKINEKKRKIGSIWLLVPPSVFIVSIVLWAISYFFLLTVGETGKAIFPIFSVILSIINIVAALGTLVGFIVGLVYLNRYSMFKLPGVFELLGQAWKVFKAKWGKIFVLLLIPILLMVFQMLMYSIDPPIITSSASKIVVGVVFQLLILIVGSLNGAAIFYIIKKRIENVGIKEAYSYAWKNILSYIWIGILYSLVTYSGMILLLIPGLIFIFWFIFSPMVFVDEGAKGRNALLKSREYGRGVCGAVFWKFFALGLLLFLVTFALVIIGMIMAIISQWILIVASIIFLILFVFIVGPVITIYTWLLYEYIKSKKGSVSIEGKPKTWLTVMAVIGVVVMAGYFSFMMYSASGNLSKFGSMTPLGKSSPFTSGFTVDNPDMSEDQDKPDWCNNGGYWKNGNCWYSSSELATSLAKCSTICLSKGNLKPSITASYDSHCTACQFFVNKDVNVSSGCGYGGYEGVATAVEAGYECDYKNGVFFSSPDDFNSAEIERLGVCACNP
jgi:hypothetical protein